MTEVFVDESDLGAMERERRSAMRLREREKERRTYLFATGKEDDRFGEEMSLYETPQDVELLVERNDHIVLFEVLRSRLSRTILFLFLHSISFLPFPFCRNSNSFSYSNVLRILERETSEIFDGFGLCCGEEKSLTGFGKVGNDCVY